MANTSDKIKLLCWILGDGPDHIFAIRVGLSNSVIELKEAILEKIRHSKMPSTLTIWNLGKWVNCVGIRRCTILTPRKVSLPFASITSDSRHLIKLEQGQQLTPGMKISEIWERAPPKGIVSVTLPRPGGGCEWLVVSTVTDSLHH